MKSKYLIVAALEEESQGLFEKLPNSNVIYTGVGKVNAAIELMSSYIPNRKAIINLGTAGCFFPSDIGKVFQVYRFLQKDLDLRFAKEDREILLKNQTLFEIKTCATSDSFVSDFDQHSLCDMEGYSLARVAAYFQAPFISLKYASDSGNIENWKKSLPDASKALYEAGSKMIKFLEKFPPLNY